MPRHPAEPSEPLFLSYSREDAEFARDLASRLAQVGRSVWIDHEIRTGDAWPAAIQRAIRGCDIGIALLSRSSLERSWPRRERRELARAGKPVVPILLEDLDLASIRAEEPALVERVQLGAYCPSVDSALDEVLRFEHLLLGRRLRRLHLKNRLLAPAVLVLAITLAIVLRVHGNTTPVERLARIDPGVYPPRPGTWSSLVDRALGTHGYGGDVEVVRAFGSVAALTGGTDYRSDLSSARSSLDLMAISAFKTSGEYGYVLSDLVRRGVHVRILVLDPELEESALEPFARYVGLVDVEGLRTQLLQTRHNLQSLQRDLGEDGPSTGRLEVRYYRCPASFTLWITDSGTPDSVAQLGVYTGGRSEEWPYVRSSGGAPGLTRTVAAVFERWWNTYGEE